MFHSFIHIQIYGFTSASNSPTVTSNTLSSTEGSAGTLSSTFSLTKSIVGMGVLALPSGLACICDDPMAVVPACAICGLFGLLSAYSFSVIARTCEETNSATFSDAWSNTVSPETSKVIPLVITSMCAMTPLAYSIMIGQSTLFIRSFTKSLSREFIYVLRSVIDQQ